MTTLKEIEEHMEGIAELQRIIAVAESEACGRPSKLKQIENLKARLATKQAVTFAVRSCPRSPEENRDTTRFAFKVNEEGMRPGQEVKHSVSSDEHRKVRLDDAMMRMYRSQLGL